MAVKFPLEMKDGVQVRNISELKENFDIEKVVGYFLDGKLKKWLDARWYEDESEEISKLDESDSLLAQHLCEIFGVEYEAEKINPEEIAARNARISKLKQYTDDEEIIKNVDTVAFDQEELADLYERDVEKIYLCEGEFKIPKSKRDLDYVLIGTVLVEGLDTQGKNQDGDIDENTLKPNVEEYRTNSYVYELKKRYIFDEKIEKICHLSNGDIYNIELNSIVKKSLNDNSEELVTTDKENIEQWIVNGDNLLYMVKGDGHIYYRNADTYITVSKNTTSKWGIKLYYVDDSKAIWFNDNTYYFSNFQGEEEIIASSNLYDNSLVEAVALYENYFWFITLANNKLYRADLSKRKKSEQVASSPWAMFRKNASFEVTLIQQNVRIAKKKDDYIYYYVIDDRKDKFYRINLAESVPVYIANGSSEFGFEVYVKEFNVSNQKIVYVAGKLFGECQLYVLDMVTRKTKRLDDSLPSAGINTYELYLEDEWLYYGVYNFGGEYLEKNRIRYDGTNKQKVNDNKFFKQMSYKEKLKQEMEALK